ncbi:MAG: hypothetical protein WCO00_16070 [Rhodospirillaceae bacterium]
MTEALTLTPEPLPPDRLIDGQPVAAGFERLQTTLAGRLSAGHAALFARPERLAGGLGWHLRTPGPAVPLASLDLTRRTQVVQRVEAMLRDVRTLGDRLQAEGAEGRRLGRQLRAIARLPPGQQIWLAGDQPVIVGWSLETSERPAGTDGVRGLGGPAAPEPAPAPPPARAAGRPRLGVILPAALALALLALLLAPGLPWPAGDGGHLAALGLELAKLEAAAAKCAPPPTP